MSKPPDWREAATFAARAHAGHFRNDGITPYASHPYRVAMTVRETFGCDDAVCLCAALLHDTIEDTPTDFDDILKLFGEETAECVAALTKDMRLRKDIREKTYDEALVRASWRAKLVKLADVLDNLTDMSRSSPKMKLNTMIRRCRRALAIAESEPAPNEALRRAMQSVRNAADNPDNL